MERISLTNHDSRLRENTELGRYSICPDLWNIKRNAIATANMAGDIRNFPCFFSKRFTQKVGRFFFGCCGQLLTIYHDKISLFKKHKSA